jgi:hypothetical protein
MRRREAATRELKHGWRAVHGHEPRQKTEVYSGSIKTEPPSPACHAVSASPQKRPRRYAQAK